MIGSGATCRGGTTERRRLLKGKDLTKTSVDCMLHHNKLPVLNTHPFEHVDGFEHEFFPAG